MELRRTWTVVSVLFLLAALSILLLTLVRPIRFVPADFRFNATTAPTAAPASFGATAAPLETAPAPVTAAPATAAPATAAPSTPPRGAPTDPGSMNTLQPIGVGDPPPVPKGSAPPKGSSSAGP